MRSFDTGVVKAESSCANTSRGHKKVVGSACPLLLEQRSLLVVKRTALITPTELPQPIERHVDASGWSKEDRGGHVRRTTYHRGVPFEVGMYSPRVSLHFDLGSDQIPDLLFVTFTCETRLRVRGSKIEGARDQVGPHQ